MDNNYSIADLAAIMKDNGLLNGGGTGLIVLLFFFIMLMNGGNGGWNRNGGYDATQQQILFGQQFQNIDNKIDRIGNGIADATFALNNSIIAEGRNTTNNVNAVGQIINDGFATMQRGFCETNRSIDGVNYNIAKESAAIQAISTANTQKILDAITGNRMADMQNQINALQLQSVMCGVVRYPMQTVYAAQGGSPFCNYQGGGCGSCNGGNI